MKSAPSSTSSSEPVTGRPGKGAILLLLALCVAFSVVLELASRWAFPLMDRGQAAVAAEYRGAVEARDSAGDRRTLLLLGNSLLDAGIRMDQVNVSLGPLWEARRLMIVDTSGLDWLFGIRRLLAEGARPDAIVVAVSPRQLVSSAVRGEYFARHLMKFRDALAVARAVGLDRTKTSSLLFANVSEFYGTRSEIRKDVLIRLMPGLPQLTALLTRSSTAPLDAGIVRRESEPRLRALKAAAEAEGAHFALVLMPTASADARGISAAVVAAANLAGVNVLVPAASEAFEDRDFRDGFHLAENGAAKFTANFVPLLRARLLDGAWKRPHETQRANPGAVKSGRM